MMNDESPPSVTAAAAALRQRAEALFLERSSQTLDTLSPEKARQLLHELQVHQIELEMQNGEMQRLHLEMEASRARYFDLYDLAPVGYLTVSEAGTILEANVTAARMLGVPPSTLVTQPLTRFIVREDQDVFYLQRKQLHEMAVPQNFELRLSGRDQQPFWAHLAISLATDADGAAETRIVLTDISTRKQAEAELRETLEFSHNLIDSMQDGFSVLDPDGLAVEANLALCRMTGFSREELIGSGPPHPYWPPEEHEQIFAALSKTMKGGSHTFGLTFMRRNGERFPVIVSPFSVADKDGKILSYAATVRDISERKQAQEALASERNLLHALVDLLPTWIFVKDRESRFLLANQACAKNMGAASPEAMVGKSDVDFYPPEVAARLRLEELGVMNGTPVENQETVKESPDGRRHVLLIHKVPLRDLNGTITGLVGAAFDITELKEAEDELRAADQKLRLHFEQTPMAVIEWDLDFRVTQWNPAARTIFGHSREEALGQHASFIVPKAFHHLVDEVWQALLHKSGGERSTNPNVGRDGTPILCEWYNTPLIDERGTVKGVASVVMDITERTHSLQLLAWEKSALEAIGSSAPLATVLHDLMLGLEQQLPDALCSVLLLDADGIHLRTGAAASLPEAYNQAMDGIVIGPTSGSCGTAAFLKRQIIVADIASDPLWADYREVAAHYDLHACWSTPILCSQGKALGTFAVYYREPRHPVPAELELIERAVHVVRIAIERKRAEEEILQLNTGLEQRVQQRTAELQAANASLTDFKAALDEHAIVSITDVAGTITYTNDKFCEISKYSREELLGQNHRIINSGYHPPAFFHELWQTIRSGRVWKGEVKNHAKDGTVYWVSSTIVPFLGPDGKPSQFIAIRTDITKRKLAEEVVILSEERLRLATEAAGVAVWEWDLTSDDLKWDEQMFRIYGLPPNPEGRAHYSDWQGAVLPADLAEQEAQLQHTIAICGRSQREFRITRASDHAVRVIQAAEMVVTAADGKAARVVGINLDITERRQSEVEISKLNADLQSRAAELEAANKELEAFSYSVSHDLRAPLRAVDGFSRMVVEDYSAQLDADGQRMLGVIREETQRMGRLIDDLLAFSRLGRQQMEPMPVNMHELAQEVYDDLAGHEPERRLRLELQPLPPACGSEALIRQVWVNLISNAIKFTKERECGEIEIGTRDGEDGRPVYYVKDNGAGFDMRYADKLFGVFQRLHNQQEFAGTGVGLALVQRIVQRHGGHVWAEAEVDHGATFYFTIPNQNP